jgi:hypothetical protein
MVYTLIFIGNLINNIFVIISIYIWILKVVVKCVCWSTEQNMYLQTRRAQNL